MFDDFCRKINHIICIHVLCTKIKSYLLKNGYKLINNQKTFVVELKLFYY